MTTVTIDTLMISQRFQEAGFSKKQSAGAAKILADLLTPWARNDETAAVASKLESLEAGQAVLHADNVELRAGFNRLEAMITKLTIAPDEVRRTF